MAWRLASGVGCARLWGFREGGKALLTLAVRAWLKV
jgi:hypothetical protein